MASFVNWKIFKFLFAVTSNNYRSHLKQSFILPPDALSPQVVHAFKRTMGFTLKILDNMKNAVEKWNFQNMRYLNAWNGFFDIENGSARANIAFATIRTHTHPDNCQLCTVVLFRGPTEWKINKLIFRNLNRRKFFNLLFENVPWCNGVYLELFHLWTTTIESGSKDFRHECWKESAFSAGKKRVSNHWIFLGLMDEHKITEKFAGHIAHYLAS